MAAQWRDENENVLAAPLFVYYNVCIYCFICCLIFDQHEIESALLVLTKSDMLTKSTSLSPLSLIEPVIINICEVIYV